MLVEDKEGLLKKRSCWVIDADSDYKTPVEGLEGRSSRMVFVSDIDEAKKELPLFKRIIPEESIYGAEFPTKEVLSKRQLKLLIETYKWAKKWLGDSE